MKKNDLLKTIGICFLVFVLLSWIIPTGSYSTGTYVKGDFSPVGIIDLLYYPIITFGTFIQYGLLFLIIGGFYGVMNETGVYSKLVSSFSKKFENKKKLFLILTISVLALLSALTNLQLPLFLLVPLLVAVIMTLGYDKITAFASTIGAIIVGGIGSLYGSNNGHINTSLSLDVNNNIVAKIILLVVLVFLLIMFILKKAKISKKNEMVEIPLLDNTETNNKSFLPLTIIIGIAMLSLLVSMYNWNYILGITYFQEVYDSIMKVTIKDYPIFMNLIGDVSPFGYWDTYEMCFVLVIASLLISWVYSIKMKDAIKGFTEGAKKMLKVAFFATLSNIIFTLMIASSDSSILNTIVNYLLSMSENFNIIVVSLITIIGSLFHNNFYYFSSTVLSSIQIFYTDVNMYGVLGILFQGIHGLMMMILPTSMFMIAGLSMLDISFKEWFKYIWKYLIWTFIIILIVAILVFMII